jgi:hypothetical protein
MWYLIRSSGSPRRAWLAARGHRVRLVHQHGVIDLEERARLDDRAVLLMEHVGERVDELLVGLVVLVDQPVGGRGRDHRQERLGYLPAVAGQGGREVGQVAVDRGAVVAHRPGARPDRSAAPGGRGQAAAAGCLRLDAHGRVVLERVDLRVGAGEVLPVPAGRQDGRERPVQLPRLQPGRPLVQVGDPGRLAHLAVVDDVDARLDLPAHDVVNGIGQRRLVLGAVCRGRAVVGRRQEGEQFRRSNQASRMRDRDSLHRNSELGHEKPGCVLGGYSSSKERPVAGAQSTWIVNDCGHDRVKCPESTHPQLPSWR